VYKYILQSSGHLTFQNLQKLCNMPMLVLWVKYSTS